MQPLAAHWACGICEAKPTISAFQKRLNTSTCTSQFQHSSRPSLNGNKAHCFGRSRNMTMTTRWTSYTMIYTAYATASRAEGTNSSAKHLMYTCLTCHNVQRSACNCDLPIMYCTLNCYLAQTAITLFLLTDSLGATCLSRGRVIVRRGPPLASCQN